MPVSALFFPEIIDLQCRAFGHSFGAEPGVVRQELDGNQLLRKNAVS
jgi:hypothetical protein